MNLQLGIGEGDTTQSSTRSLKKHFSEGHRSSGRLSERVLLGDLLGQPDDKILIQSTTQKPEAVPGEENQGEGAITPNINKGAQRFPMI